MTALKLAREAITMNKLIKLFTAAMLLACANVAVADPLKFSAGSGIQYAGKFGYQGSIDHANERYRISVSDHGATIGYDKFFAKNLSYGGQVFKTDAMYGIATNLNFYLSSQNEDGLLLGFDVYTGYGNSEPYKGLNEFEYDDSKWRAGIFISIGFQFTASTVLKHLIDSI